MGVPEMTAEQRAEALAKASRMRRERAALLGAIKRGAVLPEAALLRRDQAATGTRVLAYVKSWPGYGETKARALLDGLGIKPNKRLGGLGKRQRQALADFLRERPPRAPRKA